MQDIKKPRVFFGSAAFWFCAPRANAVAAPSSAISAVKSTRASKRTAEKYFVLLAAAPLSLSGLRFPSRPMSQTRVQSGAILFERSTALSKEVTTQVSRQARWWRLDAAGSEVSRSSIAGKGHGSTKPVNLPLKRALNSLLRSFDSGSVCLKALAAQQQCP